MASKNIKGITIEIGGNTTKLESALKDVDKQVYSLNGDLKNLNQALKLDPKNTELLAQKQDVLRRNIEETTKRLNTLKEAQRQMGEYSSLTDEQKKSYNALSLEITKAEKSLKDLNSELKKSSSYSLDKLNDSLSGVRDLSTKLVKDLAKVGTAIAGVLTTIGTLSIKTYAEYEQLIGGVEAMFGGMEKGADQIAKIQKTAQNAWKELTLSQNDYYKMFTSTYPLVKSSIDDQNEAIEVTNRLLRLNSDLSNTFGYDIETASNAVNWALKGSFNYIDNLNIGIKGTQEGFLEAAKNTGYLVDDVKDLTSSQILDVLENYAGKYGVLGRTSKEAATTISGSVKSMKASWNNLLLAVSDDNADMEKSVNNFIGSVKTAGQNITPRIKIAIEGIKKLVKNLIREVFPELKRQIPELKPLIEVFEWFVKNNKIVITAIKGIIAAFVVTKIIDFATKIKNVITSLTTLASSSVIGAVTIAITGLIAVATALTEVFHKETEAEKEARLEMEKNTDTLNEQVDSWNDLQKAQEEQIAKGKGELSYYENLYDELKSITDENGKVQDGYEKRASFIVSELQKAFGIEIQYQDGIIQNNQDIANSIDKIMEKKKAEIIIDAQKSLYGEAKTKEAEAIQNLMYWQDQLKIAEDELLKSKFSNSEAEKINAQAKYDSIKESYDKQQDVVKNYQFTIAQYEQNLEHIHNEEYDKIDTRTWNSVKATENAGDSKKAELESQIKIEKEKLDNLEKAYKETGDEIYKKQIENSKKTLKNLNEDLKTYTNTVNENKGAMTAAGENYISGLGNGMENKRGWLSGIVSGLAAATLSNMKKGLKENSPSKATREMGQYLVEGLQIGINDEEQALLKQVDNVGTNVISSLYDNTMDAMKGLNAQVSNSINPTINPTIATEINYKMMAQAVKEALQDMDVVMDDDKMGKFISKKVTDEIYS